VEKIEAQKQIDIINSIVSDKDRHYPISYKVLINWSILSAIMIYFTPIILENYGMNYMVIFLSIFMSVGLTFDMIDIKKNNIKHELIMTPNQKFVMRIWSLMSIFAIVLTALFANKNMSELIYPTWLFSIGLANYITGFLFLKGSCRYAIISIIVGILFFIIDIFIDDKEFLYHISQYSALLILSGGIFILGLVVRKKELDV